MLKPDEKAIFQAARQIEAPVARASYLAEACGNDRDLAKRLEALLRVHDHDKSFLQSPIEELRTLDAAALNEGPGTLIGRYKLLEQVGEGGMGTVWAAEQTEPVRRVVAVKLIKAGMDSKTVLSRFEAERQALAVMDHPNIAKVLDGGATESGRPFFVMEYVKGKPITAYCDEARFSISQRLALFVSVCQAVQHAHQKGIIHRDLKPSNILVCQYDRRPVPKVIDFGLAKAMHGQLTERTLHSVQGVLLGTPLYMSPEQAEFNNLDVDTRSDIYALGVILYELLTGTTPLERRRFEQAAWQEMLRLIREEEPPRPSARLSSSDSLPSVAAQRQLEPLKLTRLVRGELDWIVMKALDKDRNRRYETANGFGQDLERYLADEPVMAGPPSRVYRLRKFVRRHRGPVLAATVILFALVAGIVGTTLGLIEAEQARKDEFEQRQVADQNATKALEEEGKARKALALAQQLTIDEKSARDRAEKQLARAEWLLYASRINLTQQAWEANDARLAHIYLRQCRPELRGWEHNYLFTLFSSGQRTFRGHEKEVSRVAVSQDGKRIASGALDRTISIWNAESGQRLHVLRGFGQGVVDLALTGDGKRLFASHHESKGFVTTVWDVVSGQPIRNHRPLPNGIALMAMTPDDKRIAFATTDRTLTLFHIDTGQQVRSNALSQPVGCLAVSADGKRVVGGCQDGMGTVYAWDVDANKVMPVASAHASVSGVALSADGKHVVCGSWDGVVQLWDAMKISRIHVLKGHRKGNTCVALSRNGKRIISGGIDGTLKTWDADSGQEIRNLRGHTGAITSVAMAEVANLVVTGSGDHTVKIWDPKNSQGPRTLECAVSALAISRDGTQVVTGGRDGRVRIWDAPTGRESRSVLGHKLEIVSIALSPDGRRLVSGSSDGNATLWDAATLKAIRTFKGHKGPVAKVAFSANQERVVSLGIDGVAIAWGEGEGENSNPLRDYPVGPDLREFLMKCVAISPDGARVVRGAKTGAVGVFEIARGQRVLTIKGHSFESSCAAVSDDGAHIFTGWGDGTAILWDAATGRRIVAVNHLPNGVFSVAMSPDGKRLVTGGGDGTIKLWDAVTGQETLALQAHASAVTMLAISRDGKRMVSGSDFDGSVKIWDASNQQIP